MDNQKLLNDYLDWKASYTTHAASRYKQWIERLLAFLKKPVSQITIYDVVYYEKYIKTHFSPQTVQLAVTAIRGFFMFYWKMRYELSFNPELIRIPKAPMRLMPYLTEGEYNDVLKVLEYDTYRELQKSVFFRLLYKTGFRVSEMTGLDLANVDTVSRKIIVKTRKNNTLKIGVWDDETHERLCEYLGVRLCEAQGEALFPKRIHSGNKERIVTRTGQRWIDELCKRAGIKKKVTPHQLRRGKAVYMLNHGANLKNVQDQLGHLHLKSTEPYLPYSDKDKERVFRQYV